MTTKPSETDSRQARGAASTAPSAKAPPHRATTVLSTLNVDGSRRWLNPRLSHGPHYRRRRRVAILLLVLFTSLPFVRIGGEPALFLDVIHRRFTFFGTTFLAEDGPLVGLLVVGIFLTIFLLTAIVGRVWCGYACPQTVFLEFVYRPLERLFDRIATRRRNGAPGPLPPDLRLARFLAWLVVSLVLANTFLAYFVGVEALGDWMTKSPLQHPGPFVVMGVTTLLMMIDFAFFREQMCTITCPYGRFQSVMFDRATRLIAYDTKRGEPRGKPRDGERQALGDCIDCRACVVTCPTGIDIRNGVQMECVACAQCVDACDSIMAKLGRAPGLVRYASLDQLEGKGRSVVRPRILAYGAIVIVVLSILAGMIASREPIDVHFLRTRSTPYRETADGMIDCPIALLLTNRLGQPHRVSIRVPSAFAIAGGSSEVELGAFESATLERSVVVPRSAFENGRARLVLDVALENGEVVTCEKTLAGPLGNTAPATTESSKSGSKE